MKHPSLVEQRMGRCRHYGHEPGLKGGPTCACGQDVEALATPGGDPESPRTGIINRYPCFARNTEYHERCADLSFYTEKEAKAWAAEKEKDISATILVANQIHDKHPGEGNAHGEMDCPTCGGRVRYRRTFIRKGRKSLAAQCITTENCISFRGH